MKRNLNTDQIVEQSKAAYKQWCEQWRDHAKQHKAMGIKTSFMDFANVGVGRALVICGNGYSLEENIDTLKKYSSNVDIMVCDKAMGHLLDNDIVPQYVVVCDANVSFEEYCEPWKDKLDQSIMFTNVCANPKWAKENWKNRCLFVNQDSINSEKEFGPLGGCPNFLPAATNVSNQMVVLATQSSNKGRNNWFGYDKIILLGFDYSWSSEGNYYAFDKDARGKHNYMRHAYCLDRAYRPCFSSSNLIFSAKWLEDYIKGFKLPIVSGTDRTLLGTVPTKNLEKQLQYNYRQHDNIVVRGLSDMKVQLIEQLRKIDERLGAIGIDHMSRYRESI